MKFEQYMNLIESTHQNHKQGNLNEMEYIIAYNEILDVVIDSKTLSEEEKNILVRKVRVKIGQIPLVEADRKQKQQEVMIAFEEAKKRFKKLSFFQKIKLNLKGQNPNQLSKESLRLEEVNGLYRK